MCIILSGVARASPDYCAASSSSLVVVVDGRVFEPDGTLMSTRTRAADFSTRPVGRIPRGRAGNRPIDTRITSPAGPRTARRAMRRSALYTHTHTFTLVFTHTHAHTHARSDANALTHCGVYTQGFSIYYHFIVIKINNTINHKGVINFTRCIFQCILIIICCYC